MLCPQSACSTLTDLTKLKTPQTITGTHFGHKQKSACAMLTDLKSLEYLESLYSVAYLQHFQLSIAEIDLKPT